MDPREPFAGAPLAASGSIAGASEEAAGLDDGLAAPGARKPGLSAGSHRLREGAREVGEEIREALGGSGSRVWTLLSRLLALFFVLRIAQVLIARIARPRLRGAFVRRLWPLFEGTVWLAAGLYVALEILGPRTQVALYVLLFGVLFVVAVWWNALRDVAAGLVIAAERPFEIGDVVRMAGFEGQVRRLRLRVLELQTEDNRRVLIPYREAIGASDVRTGGRRVAHSVHLELDLPAGMDPREALALAREVAASSPWAVLGVAPRAVLSAASVNRPSIEIEAYAFDAGARSLLYADLISGWRERVRDSGLPGKSEA